MVRKTFNWLSDKVIHAPKRIVALVLVITVFLAIGLPKIQIKMGNDVFVDTNSAIYKDTETYQKQFGGDNAFLLLTADNKNDSLVNHKTLDRKSTRLNSSHVSISYAVFCLKKQKE